MEISILVEEGIDLEPDWLQRVAEQTLVAENAPFAVELSLVIVGQERIRELNRSYLDRDRPTDVLAFAMSEQVPGEDTPFIAPPDGMVHLGEVLISYPQAVIQAAERHHPVKRELAILIIHGVLHLLGYDHEKSEMESKMRAREAEILSRVEKELT